MLIIAVIIALVLLGDIKWIGEPVLRRCIQYGYIISDRHFLSVGMLTDVGNK